MTITSRPIKGTTQIAAVIGWPIAHSKSPELLNAAFAAREVDAVMVPLGVPPEGLSSAIAGLRVARALGASVTVPHKIAVAALCDRLSPAARTIGAVNCLQLAETELVGHNTDCTGFSDALAEAGCGSPSRVVLLGAGGAARAVAYGLRSNATPQIDVVARDPARAVWTSWVQGVTARPWSELATALARADLVVDCTPAGLSEHDELPFVDALPLDALASGAWVATLVYHRRPILLERASERGHSILDGRGMLIHQGARAFEIWTGQAPPIEHMRAALDAALVVDRAGDRALDPSGT